MTETKPADPERVSNMTYAEMVAFYHAQLGRVEMTWFRVMYLHAAMVGVLVFFGEAEDFFLLQRAVVFAFYTVNLLIFFFALREGYDGMKHAHRDLVLFPDAEGHVENWYRTHRLNYKMELRALALAIAWLLILFLMFYGLVS